MIAGTLLAPLCRLLFLVIMLLSSAHASPMSDDSNPCARVVDTSRDNWTIAIWNPGHYCVGQDLSQSDPIFRLPHQPTPKSALLEIRSSNAFIDLNHHRLITNVNHREGVWVHGLAPSPISSITIKNGLISSTSGPTIFMVDAFDNGKDNRFSPNFAIASSMGVLSRYRPTEFILENLTLDGENHAIIMQGMKNIIRHCKIVGGNGTVNVFGPQLTFEDNEIILRAKPPTGASDDAPVALYLEDAADSVVRNNRILIKGRVTGSQAIVLKNSPNVNLSGNTVTGADSVYQLLDERSSVTSTNNNLSR